MEESLPSMYFFSLATCLGMHSSKRTSLNQEDENTATRKQLIHLKRAVEDYCGITTD